MTHHPAAGPTRISFNPQLTQITESERHLNNHRSPRKLSDGQRAALTRYHMARALRLLPAPCGAQLARRIHRINRQGATV
ncbi:hypothetical protein [Aeromonas dhakensis]|uniref:hypothetical protein n=1 Tax=Aeromonas dhakensis TaxID=196024 RepID=UPI000A7FFDB6|nr:hypothetical protein [Aeromonas dhakensis]